MLFGLCVDCMPTEVVPCLMTMLYDEWLAGCTVRTVRAPHPTDKIVEDCAQDYARTLNGIAFRAVHKADAGNELMQLLEPPPLEQERPPPERGTHLIERSQSYDDAFAAFRFQSCLTRPEVFSIFIYGRPRGK